MFYEKGNVIIYLSNNPYDTYMTQNADMRTCYQEGVPIRLMAFFSSSIS